MTTYASNAFGQLRYIAESTRGTIPGAGNAVNLRQVGSTMKASTSTVKSEEIRSDRLSTGSTRTDMNVDGGFNFELSGKEYDPFLCNLLGQSAFTHYGTSGIGTTFTATTTATTITAAVAPTTTSAFTTIADKSWIKLIPPAGASASVKAYFADAWFKVSGTPSSTVITLDAATPIVAPGLVTAIAGYAVSQSSIVNGNTFGSFSLEYALTDVSQFLTFTGMQVNDFNLDLSVGSIIKGDFSFIGQGHTIQGTTLLPGTPVASQTLEVMNSVADVGAIYENGTSVLGANSFIKSLKLSVKNNARGLKAIGTFGNVGVSLGELALSGSMEIYLQDATYYSKWLNGTNTSLSLGMADSAGNGYMFDLDKVTFSDVSTNMSGRNDVMLTVPFDAFYSPTTSRGIRITRAVAA